MRSSIRGIHRVLLVFATLVTISFASFVREARASDEEAQASDNDIHVKRLSFPVTLSDGNEYSIVGYLYYHGSYRQRTLQVAIHGGNYNHKYWDIPTIHDQDYSYAHFMAREGYAVLAIDQLGTGESSLPDGDFLTLQEAGLAIHQMMISLRDTNNALQYAFDKIVFVGHSLGSITATYVQGTYDDADGLVTTGAGHVPHPSPIDPAVIVPLLAQPYFQLPPAARIAYFYYTPEVDAGVIAYDLAELDDIIARGFVLSILPFTYASSVTVVDLVTSPVLVQLGEFDEIAPASLASQEAAFWASASSVTVQSVGGVGHDFNGHYKHLDSWSQIDQWIKHTMDCPSGDR